MKQYPHIPVWTPDDFGASIYAFDKHDGSNIRVEWEEKESKNSHFSHGFRKFGTRTQMIQFENQPFYEVITMFRQQYAERLDELFRTQPYFKRKKEVTLYFEYFGDHSFAGQHVPTEPKKLSLIDVDVYKQGLLSPGDFIEQFSSFDIPTVIYKGFFDATLVEGIRNNIYNLKEGVVCKGVRKTKGQPITYHFKVKTQTWLEQVRKLYGEKKYQEELK